MSLQELQIYGLWAGKQTAKGTPNAAPAKRFKQVAGALGITREDGSENYSDGTPYTDTQDWVNTLIGSGTPGAQATPEELAWTQWAFEGGETTSAVTGPPAKTKHTTVPLPGLGNWSTFVTRQGSSVAQRMQHNDCQIGQMQIEGSTGNKAVRMTPSVMSLDPGVQRAADPVAIMPAKATFLYTDGTSRFTIDGTVYRGQTAFTLVMNKDLQPVYSDDVTVNDLAIGNAVITISVTLVFNTDALATWNKQIYGNVAPAAGDKPLRRLPALGSYGFSLQPSNGAGVATGDVFSLALPGIKWAPPDAPDPNADGGTPEITLAGSMRKVAGQPAYTIDIDCDAAAFTA